MYILSASNNLILARRYASAVYVVVVCVCLSVRPSQASNVPKRLNIGSRK